ncbi:LMBR1-like membrane protein [Phytophthora cinnamomi]|uniref:LMBR1-like membrane protein n=1 Tax=Phytophthora cinnamomi TaxID=4785 RepID=UPI00355AA8C1|nr:LMBR1-like membrane protein [Phytophthora cinnamomi]
MGVDLFLVAVVVIIVVALLICNVYILVYFQHDDDKNTAYFPKALVVFGLFFAEATVLLLPLDVANNSTAVGCAEGWNTACGNINMDLLWLMVFLSIVIFLVVLLPFAIYYYEADDGEDNPKKSQWGEAIKMELGTVIVAAALITVLYITSAKSSVPMRALEVNSRSATAGFQAYVDGTTLSSAVVTAASNVTVQHITLTVDVSLPVAFFHRPKFISADVYAIQKLILQRRSTELLEIGRSIKQGMDRPGHGQSSWERKKQRRLDFVTLNKFKQSVYLLEGDVVDLKLCHEEYRNFNPLKPIFKLLMGCIASIISCMWFFHIALYMLPNTPLLPFLNTYFMWFDRWFPLFGTISVGIFSSYLLACAVKGCFKFGMRCFCIALHPMKLHATYMNSLVFNLGLVLLCAIPSVQFCDQAFADYDRLTALRTLLGVQIHYLKGMRTIWDYNIFIYAIIIISFITAGILMAKPRDRASPVDGIRKRIERQVRETAAANSV